MNLHSSLFLTLSRSALRFLPKRSSNQTLKWKQIPSLGQEVALDTDYLRLSFFGSLQEADLYKLLKIHNLKHLNLSCSDLSDMHLKTIGQIKTLQLLDLDSTEITAAGLHHLSALKQVHELRL
jgi:hypothetical protein